MKRSDFLKALAALPFVGLAFDALTVEETKEDAAEWGLDEIPEGWADHWDDVGDVEWSTASEVIGVEVPSDGVFSIRSRYVDAKCAQLEWSVLDSSGKQLYRGPVEPVIVSPGFPEPQP